jgi:hypothetical protein
MGAESGIGDGLGVAVLVGLAGGALGCALTFLAAGVDRADGGEFGAVVGVVGGAARRAGSGVVITACTAARDGASTDRRESSRCRCSTRANTKNGNAIATTRTVAPIE